ncbi:MAG: hypothetical protein QMD85_04405 [Candidatus Aenigmarchaeota archaeon]|nr:hypothetical protein [Candidatus Aenigmarchaeota archaeon]MDI6722816.1 hypothetical protein [Candidatus Aenigmarchaeota archaeon]
MPIKLVVWDIDKVWTHDFTTTYAAWGNELDYRPYLKECVDSGIFSYEHIREAEIRTGRKVNSVGSLSDVVKYFLYNMKDEVYPHLSDQEAKNATITLAQKLLKGLTIDRIKEIADSIPYKKGLREAIQSLRDYKAHQVGFSDGMGPLAAYKMREEDAEEIGHRIKHGIAKRHGLVK